MYYTEQISQQLGPRCSVLKGLAQAEMGDGRYTRREERPRESLGWALEGGMESDAG